MKRVRVLLVDDHPLYRQGVRNALEGLQDIQIIGEASDGQMAIQMGDTLSPDVMLVDINLPGLNGLEATRVIRRRNPHIAVIILTVHEDDEQLFNAIKVGAAAFSTKDVSQERRDSGSGGGAPPSRTKRSYQSRAMGAATIAA